MQSFSKKKIEIFNKKLKGIVVSKNKLITSKKRYNLKRLGKSLFEWCQRSLTGLKDRSVTMKKKFHSFKKLSSQEYCSMNESLKQPIN